jgi:hypothetical protein
VKRDRRKEKQKVKTRKENGGRKNEKGEWR